MKKYLIDANLPYYFSLWNVPECIHVRDINPRFSDNQIWQYAKEKNLTIITKDNDFSEKVLFFGSPPKVIHLKFGNLKMKDFHNNISKNWKTICEISSTHKLVNVFIDRIEGIN